MCVRDHSYACVFNQGLCPPPTSQHQIVYSEKLSQIFLVLKNLGSWNPLDLKANAPPIEPPPVTPTLLIGHTHVQNNTRAQTTHQLQFPSHKTRTLKSCC